MGGGGTMNFQKSVLLWIGLNWLSDWPNCRFSFCSTKSSCMKDLHTTVEVHNIYDIFMTMWDTIFNHSDYRNELNIKSRLLFFS
jgi:hypothetical protein